MPDLLTALASLASATPIADEVSLLGDPIARGTAEPLIAHLVSSCGRCGSLVATVGVDAPPLEARFLGFIERLLGADLRMVDVMPIMWASRIHWGPTPRSHRSALSRPRDG